MRADVFAGPGLVADPVALDVDARGRLWVAESKLDGAGGVTSGQLGLERGQDFLSRTPADRLDLLRSHAEAFRVEKGGDRLLRVEDGDGDGRADRSTLFADGFDPACDGPALGVLARGGDVWTTCSPSLWRFRDRDGDDRPEIRERLHTGFGVHLSAIGHGLHSLKWGPDGKIYFSTGDCGFRVDGPDGVLDYPDTGSILRCNPDGTDLEVFATGLRNPADLAFDDLGNLFTGDNNQGPTDLSRGRPRRRGGRQRMADEPPADR